MREILKEYNIKTADDINHALKYMFGGLLQEALEAELGYEKNTSKPDGTSNQRNGHTKKSVRSEHGEIELSVPRVRAGEWSPLIVRKHQKEVTGIEDYAPEDSPVRVIDAYVDSLDMEALGFTRGRLNETGRPMYSPYDLLKLYLYGYMNRIRSSRRLETEAGRNLEVIWLMNQLCPDHKTIAQVRTLNHC